MQRHCQHHKGYMKGCAACAMLNRAYSAEYRQDHTRGDRPRVRPARICSDCGKTHTRAGGTSRCVECAKEVRRQQQNNRKRRIAAEKSEQKAGQLVIGNNNACAQCAFLTECRNIVDNSIRIGDVFTDPYCFADSPYHHRYLAQYGRTPAGKARAAMGVSA